MRLFHNQATRQPRKYTPEWIHTLSDDELRREREDIYIQYIRSGPPDKRCVYEEFTSKRLPSPETLMELFDNEMINRMNRKFELEHPEGYTPRHRENGRYLPNDED